MRGVHLASIRNHLAIALLASAGCGLSAGGAHAIIVQDGFAQASLAFARQFPAVGAVLSPTGQIGSFSVCTGSLVTSLLVLTSAHCFDRDSDGDIDVTASQVQFKLGPDISIGATHTRFGSAISVPSEYAGGNNALFDLALLELGLAITNVTPMHVTESPGGNSGSIVGYGLGGTGDAGGTGSAGTKRAAVNAPYLTPDRQLLLVDFDEAGVKDEGEGLRDGFSATSNLEGFGCGGDSGGPLINAGPDVLSGVLSGAIREECTFGNVAIYTRIGLPENAAFLIEHGVHPVDAPANMLLFATASGLIIAWRLARPVAAKQIA